MELNRQEAQEALDIIGEATAQTKKALANDGTHLLLYLWGIIWIIGFTSANFLTGAQAGQLWALIDTLGMLVTGIIIMRMGKGFRYAGLSTLNKRIGLFWLCLMLLIAVIVWVALPLDGKQLSLIIVLGVIIGWVGLGLLLDFYPIWSGLLLGTTAAAAYFLLPQYYYFIMALVGGGGMIAMGYYIQTRW